MADNELRVFEEQHLRIKWADHEFTVKPRPFSQLEDVLRIVDQLGEGAGSSLAAMYHGNIKYLLEVIRFFLDVSKEDLPDALMLDNLTMQAVKWLWGIIREVNNLEYVEHFFSNASELMTMAKEAKATAVKSVSRGKRRQ